MIAIVLALTPSPASAEPLCTDTWTGPSEGTWQTASNWSTGKAPVAGDVACIGVGATVNVTTGANRTGVLEDKGTLAISGGSLEVETVLEPSSALNLSVEGGVLTGSAEVDVTGSFTGGGFGTLSGPGSTVIEAGATGAITATSGMGFLLQERTLRNAGTLTVGAGSGLGGSSKAHLMNSGTLNVNGETGAGHGLIAGKGEATLTNTGTLEKTEGAGTSPIEFAIENEGTISASSGKLEFTEAGPSGEHHVGSWSAAGAGTELVLDDAGGVFALGASAPMSGSIEIAEGTVTAGKVEGAAASVTINGHGLAGVGTLEVNGASPSTLQNLTITDEEGRGGGVLTGSAEVDVTGSFIGGGFGTLSGSGSTVIEPGATGTISATGGTGFFLQERTLRNAGTLTVGRGSGLGGSSKAHLVNSGTLVVNGETAAEGHGLIAGKGEATLTNTGTLEKTEGSGVTPVEFGLENLGIIESQIGQFEVLYPIIVEAPEAQLGSSNPSAFSNPRSMCGKPVDCVTGNETESQTDFAIGGRGVGLDLVRTYNAQAAAKASSAGPFGYGWTGSYSDHLVVEPGLTTLHQANASTVPFTESGGKFTAPLWSADTLTGSLETGFVLTLADQTKYRFSGSGRLESEEDRNANATTLEYDEKGQLTAIVDPAGRKIKLSYNAEGLVEAATDPLGHVVSYAYESGNLASVTLPEEASPNWRFKYGGSHRMTSMINGLGGETTNSYDGADRVISQKDPLGHTLEFEYEPFQTKVTNEATGAVTLEKYGSDDLIRSITRGYGTSGATTQTTTYDERGEPTAITDGDGHTTRYEYDGAGDRTKTIDANEHETKWTYDSTHDVETMTTPRGETTTIKRDSHGNPEAITSPAPKETTQTTKYTYDAHGEVESMTDSLSRVWKYEYDGYGDRTSETDPEADKRTWAYNEDSQETSIVSPRGNVTGGKPSEYTTKIERDAQGRALVVVDPLGHKTAYTYDADGNVETVTDANGHKTTYTYDADNQPIKVKQPNGIVTETGYDGAGRVVSQVDGKKNETKYVRNVLEEVTEAIDPRGRKTVKEYDGAGNLKALIDPALRTTTYTYDPAHGLKPDVLLKEKLTQTLVGDVRDHPLGNQVVRELGKTPSSRTADRDPGGRSMRSA